jgi:MFS family permease
MRVIGKRPVYLLSLPLLAAANIWSYKATSFNSLLAASIVSGFAASAGDATVPAVVADLFFVHQRGTVMMIFHMTLSCGFFIGPLINAYVVQYSSWRNECLWIAVVTFALWSVAFFTVYESSYYHRDVNALGSSFGPKKSFAQLLSVTGGYNKEANFFVSVYNTVAVVAYPPVLWAGKLATRKFQKIILTCLGLTVGTFVGWNIVVQLTSSRTFTVAPYNWLIGSLGLLSISGFIGAAIAIFFGGKLIDIIANRMTHRNHGRREPEYRLPGKLKPPTLNYKLQRLNFST